MSNPFDFLETDFSLVGEPESTLTTPTSTYGVEAFQSSRSSRSSSGVNVKFFQVDEGVCLSGCLKGLGTSGARFCLAAKKTGEEDCGTKHHGVKIELEVGAIGLRKGNQGYVRPMIPAEIVSMLDPKVVTGWLEGTKAMELELAEQELIAAMKTVGVDPEDFVQTKSDSTHEPFPIMATKTPAKLKKDESLHQRGTEDGSTFKECIIPEETIDNVTAVLGDNGIVGNNFNKLVHATDNEVTGIQQRSQAIMSTLKEVSEDMETIQDVVGDAQKRIGIPSVELRAKINTSSLWEALGEVENLVNSKKMADKEVKVWADRISKDIESRMNSEIKDWKTEFGKLNSASLKEACEIQDKANKSVETELQNVKGLISNKIAPALREVWTHRKEVSTEFQALVHKVTSLERKAGTAKTSDDFEGLAFLNDMGLPDRKVDDSFGLLGRMEELEERMNQMQAGLDTSDSKGMTADGHKIFGSELPVKGLPDAIIWSKTHFGLPDSCGTVIDAVSALYFCNTKHMEGDQLFNKMSKTKTAGITWIEEKVLLSMQNPLPPVFGGHNTDSTLPLPKVDKYEVWQSSSHSNIGLKHNIQRDMQALQDMLKREIGRLRSTEARRFATECLNHSVQFVAQLSEFITKMYRELTDTNSFSSKDAWGLVAKVTRRIFDDMGRGRAMALNIAGEFGTNREHGVGTVLIATLNTHRIMDEYMQRGFEDHPSVASELVLFLVRSLNSNQSGGSSATDIAKLKLTLNKTEAMAKLNTQRLDSLTNKAETYWKTGVKPKL